MVVKETITAAELLERLRFFEVEAEKAYGRMYDARPGSDLAACYSDAKEALHEAIGFARRLGLSRETERLEKRLSEIKTIFRHQFPA
ncbi:MAG TPA: hypothetical protein VK193_08425 [Methyloceanibacter sp.]|nr:hypothetical protein [Methyloceanibacter sp.]